MATKLSGDNLRVIIWVWGVQHYAAFSTEMMLNLFELFQLIEKNMCLRATFRVFITFGNFQILKFFIYFVLVKKKPSLALFSTYFDYFTPGSNKHKNKMSLQQKTEISFRTPSKASNIKKGYLVMAPCTEEG